MHTITPNPERESSFFIKGDVRPSTLEAAQLVSTIEGMSFEQTVQKVLSIYDEVDTKTRGFGRTLHHSLDLISRTTGRIPTPREYLRQTPLPHANANVLMIVDITETTKERVDYYTERDKADFDLFITGAFSYYGMLATYVYGGEEVYIRKKFSSNLERIGI